MGVFGFILELYGVPLAPIVLGLILGGEVEHKFLQCITKDSSATAFLAASHPLRREIVRARGVAIQFCWVPPAVPPPWPPRRCPRVAPF
jgi:TctA family transporter